MRSFAELPFSTDESGGGPILPPLIPSSSTVFSPSLPQSYLAQDDTSAIGIPEDDLLALWISVTDPAYHRPLLADESGKTAAVGAAVAIHRRVSETVEASTQSLYIRRWSGQTYDPARTARLADGFLDFSRTPTDVFPAWLPVVFPPAQLLVDHVGLDWSPDGPVEFLSGRRYQLTRLSSLGSGLLGPLRFPATAEKPGSSYNEPWPGTITRPFQPGSAFQNTALSTQTPSAGVNWLVLSPSPDVLSAQQIGQYVLLSSPPAVAGQVRRVVGYLPPFDSSTGGTALLDTLGVYRYGSLSGVFQIGEELQQASSGARGLIVSDASGHLGVETTLGVFVAGAVVGVSSGATASITQVVRESALPAASSVAWQVLDWGLDVGLSVTNPQRFTGGRLPVLEELGAERQVYRASNEPEEVYRQRVATADDVVSPNALLRVANRILAPYGGKACLREVGTDKLPGLFFDVPPDGDPAHAFAFDMNPVVRPGDRWKVLLSFADFRAFFLMGVPRFGLGDFGGYADVDPNSDGDVYFDGYAVTDAALHSAVYAGLKRAKSGGVGFELYVESGGCV